MEFKNIGPEAFELITGHKIEDVRRRKDENPNNCMWTDDTICDLWCKEYEGCIAYRPVMGELTP